MAAYYILAFVLSLAIHISIIAVMEGPEPLDRPKEKRSAQVIITPRKEKTPTVEAKATRSTKSSVSGATKSVVGKGNARTDKTIVASPKPYADLFPKSGEWSGEVEVPVADARDEEAEDASLIPTHRWQEGRSGVQKQALLRDAGTLHTLFDIPLEARKLKSEGRAKVTLEYHAETETLYLRKLAGDPLLKAVLFERLQDANTLRAVREVLENLETRRLQISLYLGAKGRSEEDDFLWQSEHLRIFKARALPDQPLPIGAVQLPDEHAKKAKRWDRQAYVKLTNSQAYHAVIRNRVLCTGC